MLLHAKFHRSDKLCFSIPLKERLTIQNVESILQNIRQRIETGREVNHRTPPTMALTEHLISWKTSSQVTISLLYNSFSIYK